MCFRISPDPGDWDLQRRVGWVVAPEWASQGGKLAEASSTGDTASCTKGCSVPGPCRLSLASSWPQPSSLTKSRGNGHSTPCLRASSWLTGAQTLWGFPWGLHTAFCACHALVHLLHPVMVSFQGSALATGPPVFLSGEQASLILYPRAKGLCRC